LLFEIWFYRQAPGTLVSITDRFLVHEKHPGKNEGDARRLRWRVWSGKGWGRTRAYHGSVCAHGRGREALGGGLRRWPAVPAAGASAPARWTARLGHQQHGEAVWSWVKSLGRYGRVGLQRTAGEGGPSAERIGSRWQRAEERSAAALIAGDSFSSPRSKDPTFTPQYGDHPRLACTGTGDGPLGARLWYGAARTLTRRARVPRRHAWRVTGCSCLEAVGPGQHGRRGGGTRSTRRRDATQIAGALQRGRSDFQPVNATLTARNFKNLNCPTKIVDTKVVDETSLYHICKGRPMFFSMVWVGTPSKVRVLPSADE
jgi:hypothetical protein